MNILITGGFGYVGSKICQNLYKSGHNLYIIDNLLQKTGKIGKYDQKI